MRKVLIALLLMASTCFGYNYVWLDSTRLVGSGVTPDYCYTNGQAYFENTSTLRLGNGYGDTSSCFYWEPMSFPAGGRILVNNYGTGTENGFYGGALVFQNYGGTFLGGEGSYMGFLGTEYDTVAVNTYSMTGDTTVYRIAVNGSTVAGGSVSGRHSNMQVDVGPTDSNGQNLLTVSSNWFSTFSYTVTLPSDVNGHSYVGVAGSSVGYNPLQLYGYFQVAQYVIPGDADLNGWCSFADYLTLESNFGQSGKVWSTGDFNGDGWCNTADYLLLESGFGKHTPEPVALAFLGIGGLLLNRRR